MTTLDIDAALPPWHVAVDGCTNFRDAGGWPVAGGGRMRLGRLYRSDDPVRLTTEGRASVEALGLGFVVDLRQQSQVVRTPGFLPVDRTAHIPLLDRVIDPNNPPPVETSADIAALYLLMLDRSREQLGRTLDTVAERLADGPVLVHCAFGKDRAGLVTALVQATIGVGAESICADYARSHEPGRRRRTWMLAEPLPDDPDASHVPELFFTAFSETMRLLLDRVIVEHGSLTAWAATFPTGPDTVGRLRDALVET